MKQNPQKFQRPFLKWAGGKYRLLPRILKALPTGKKLIEPFVGSGVVFLNTNYDRYLLSDINPDLINLFNDLKKGKNEFIDYCSEFFTEKTNNEKYFYQLREHFNQLKAGKERSALFLYFNRHGYNGLCRYNRSGGFNVPFGRYKRPYFPAQEMEIFYQKSQKAEFRCQPFLKTMAHSRKGSVIYCDPPYLPWSLTANFTSYAKQDFSLDEQRDLALEAAHLAERGVPVVVANHDTPFARMIYEKASKIESFPVRRFISCDGKGRTNAQEVMAIYSRK
ncbi:Dam family site-specific DNA-(adenine-N6)-methyltransferase [Kangiella sp. HZ709]|uniref:Dam family site-specific DNA-(adenine-N6)-methyltransferase n=1 Tax=Kangiella sp. HZ709 TaxID=2666328 RepID=UPI0012B15686|nr:Dam family site-specific DNA-(adenine-N6)-methyltransferase [Kangiella sp. HZ709]MRX28614.1 Dam family site-specific DNA-(adenine-N6)-methyltransferase [Kangiella sp. HZ709]